MPVYHGAPNIADWLPNENSIVRVDDFGSAKELADHLKMLDENEEEYVSLLQHKPSFSTNAKLRSQVTNDNLINTLKGQLDSY